MVVITQNGWFIMENPIKMNDLGIPLFLETPIWLFQLNDSKNQINIQKMVVFLTNEKNIFFWKLQVDLSLFFFLEVQWGWVVLQVRWALDNPISQQRVGMGGMPWCSRNLVQEISNGRTHWTDPEKTWVSNSSSNFLRGLLVRSHSICDGSWRKNTGFSGRFFFPPEKNMKTLALFGWPWKVPGKTKKGGKTGALSFFFWGLKQPRFVDELLSFWPKKRINFYQRFFCWDEPNHEWKMVAVTIFGSIYKQVVFF